MRFTCAALLTAAGLPTIETPADLRLFHDHIRILYGNNSGVIFVNLRWWA